MMSRAVVRNIIRKFLIVAVLASATVCAHALDTEALKRALDLRSLDPVEGVWQWPDDGAIIAAVRNSETTFSLIAIDSPTLTLPSAAEFGTLVTTTTPGTYMASINTAINKHGAFTKPHNFVLRVSSDGNMSLHQYSNNVRLSFWRWIPYLFRVGVLRGDRTAEGLDGPVKIYPRAENGESAHPVLL